MKEASIATFFTNIASYGVPSLKACLSAFEQWAFYQGAIDIWTRNFNYVEQLYDYGSALRKIMYTTNVVESIHSSFRKVTKKRAFQTRTPF
ncbi:hypothetical protein GCM10026983_10300 [Gracilibacillus alcaliphilus]